MVRPRKDNTREATTERILNAAEALFSEKGFAKTSLREVAEHAGIKAPSLLYHFKTKEQLFNEVIRRTYQQIEQLLDAHTLNVDEDGQWLATFFSALIVFEKEHHQLILVLNEGLFSTSHLGAEVIKENFVPLLDKFETRFRQLATPKIPESVPVRQAILHIIIAYSARRSLGELGDELWGAEDQSIAIAMKLMDAVRHWH